MAETTFLLQQNAFIQKAMVTHAQRLNEAHGQDEQLALCDEALLRVLDEKLARIKELEAQAVSNVRTA